MGLGLNDFPFSCKAIAADGRVPCASSTLCFDIDMSGLRDSALRFVRSFQHTIISSWSSTPRCPSLLHEAHQTPHRPTHTPVNTSGAQAQGAEPVGRVQMPERQAMDDCVRGLCRALARGSARDTARGGRKLSAGVRGAAEGAGVLGVELSVVFGLVSKGYGVCSFWVHGW